MKPRLPDSPAGLIAATLLGTLIASTIFLAPTALLHRGSLAIRLLAGPALGAAGLALFLKSFSDLKQGVRNDRWPEAQIAPLRRICESPFYTALSIVLLIAFAALALPSTHFRGLGWTFYLLGQFLLQLRIAVLRPRTKPPQSSDWHNFGPIRSDHWGER